MENTESMRRRYLGAIARSEKRRDDEYYYGISDGKSRLMESSWSLTHGIQSTIRE